MLLFSLMLATMALTVLVAYLADDSPRPPFGRWFLARFRLSDRAVCELSKGKGMIDYHDYPDDAIGQPWHFSPLTCRRCGKEFMI